MVKKSTKKKNIKSRLKSLSKKQLVFIAIGLVIISVFTYKQLGIYLQKRSFDSKQAQMQELTEKVSKELPPNNQVYEKYCQYSSKKFEKGDLSCVSNKIFNYSDTSSESADRKKDRISKILGLTIEESSYQKANSQQFTYIQEGEYWNSYISKTGIENCSIYYYFNLDNNLTNNLTVSFSCYIPFAKKEYFPVKN